MNMNYLEKFDKFIALVWISIWIVFCIQFTTSTSILEACLFSLASVLSFYPLTTYLSNNLLKKAIQKKAILKFTIQFFSISLLMSILILCLYVLFSRLEKTGIFPDSSLFENHHTSIYDAVGAAAAVVLINFGFCGLRFFEENLRLHKTIMESRLQVLQAQINPHFMFNVLNHVNILIKKEPDLASSLLVQYTAILRHQLYSGKKDWISIGQEAEFLKDFIEIEKIRWKNNLLVTCSWSIEDDTAKLTPLLLITFIENAFKHVSRSKTEKGYVRIRLEQQGDTINLQVENSKFADEFDKGQKDRPGLGLENIKKRLDILYPDKYSLVIDQTATTYSTSLKIQI